MATKKPAEQAPTYVIFKGKKVCHVIAEVVPGHAHTACGLDAHYASSGDKGYITKPRGVKLCGNCARAKS